MRVAAVQWERKTLPDENALRAALAQPLVEAVRRGAQFVAFPVGPGDALARITIPTPGGRGAAPFGSVEAEAKVLQSRFTALGSALARQYSVTLSLGPLWIWGADGPQRIACLFGPDGQLLGEQPQTHRSLADRAAGMRAGDWLQPIASPVGLVGLLTGADLAYPEVSRILCLQGAEILVYHGAQRRFHDALALAGLWREVQANQVFGIEAYCVGDGFCGRSAIHAPVELVADHTGWLARATSQDAPEVVVADLDASALKDLLTHYPIFALRNLAQYRHYMPEMYEQELRPPRSRVAKENGHHDSQVSPRGLPMTDRFHTRGLATGALASLLGLAVTPFLSLKTRRSALAPVQHLPAQRAPQPQRPRVRVGVAQLSLDLVDSPAEYQRRIHRLALEAVDRGASLVIFPEYASLPLLGLLPGAAWLARHPLPSKGGGGVRGDPCHNDEQVMALALWLAAPAARRVYLATFASLAKRLGALLLGGSIIERTASGALANVAYLFGPDGQVLARQSKTHLVPSEVAMGYTVGEEIEVVETPAGRLAFPVCMDHTYFETARIAALRGAELLIDPAANNEYYDPYFQARGVWGRVQEVQILGVLCCGVGCVAGMPFQGRSAIYAPLDMTPTGDGILALASTCDREEVLVADLDYAALAEFRQRNPLEFNLALYRKYLPAAYELKD